MSADFSTAGGAESLLQAIADAGLAGVEEGLTLPSPIQQDPGGWTDDERGRDGIARLPATHLWRY